MSKKIKVNIVSDIVCPWCLVGYLRFEKAADELGIKNQIEINWVPFELNPDMPEEGQNLQEHLTEKYGTTPEDQKKSYEMLAAMAAEQGFEFNFYEDMRMFNTRDAHILIDFAKDFGLHTELNLRFITAFYKEQKDISKRDILLNELEAVGLDKVEAEKTLNNDEARFNIIQEEHHWKKMGVTSTPTFVFEDMSAIPGAQPVDVFKDALAEMLEK